MRSPLCVHGKSWIKQMNFADKWDAISWMCRNQLGRRNLTDEQRTYLIGKQYEAQKMTVGDHAVRGEDGKYLSGQNGHLGEGASTTRDILAKKHGIGSRSVQRAEQFAKSLDEADKSFPGIRESVLSGEVKAPKNLISEIRKIPEEHRSDAVEAIKTGDWGSRLPPWGSIGALGVQHRPIPKKSALSYL